ncbi:MAG: FAD-dependent oxidoreductase [Opitutales bacterium]|nr:FAD-dependent oxidoreductase [Opitutales bacterium]
MKKAKSSTASAPRIVIVGAVAGGASAAARARRLNEHASVTLFEKGPDVSFANCGLPYHIGGEIPERSRLALQTPESLKATLNVDAHIRHEVLLINREAKSIQVRNLVSGDTFDAPYDKLILSPGASPIRPPLPGLDDPRILTLRNLEDMDRIKSLATTSQRVLVIGAGFIGLEMAEQLTHLKKEVTLVELQKQVLPQMDPDLVRPVENALRKAGVQVILGDAVESFTSRPDAVEAWLKTGTRVLADLVILSIGVRPESALAKEADLTLGPRGHIVVNEWQQTSDPDIYAVGDVAETPDPILGNSSSIPLGGPANRQGRVAADHILIPDSARPYPGSIGTSIVRVFGVDAGITGCNQARLRASKVEFEGTTVTDFHHASYFPGAQDLTLRILWDKSTGRILGAQAVGPKGVDKRIDVMATAIRGKMALADLEHLELSYAPPFGSAKDVVNIAGFAALNRLDGLLDPVDTLEAIGPDAQIVDVRPAVVSNIKGIPGALNIPLEELRQRLQEIDPAKPVLTVCAKGKMSYFAARVLQQHGFKARSLSGGLALQPETPPAEVIQPVIHPETAQTPEGEPQPALSGARTRVLDATGLACPGPILRLSNTLAELSPGDVLRVRASDSGFPTDFTAFCTSRGLENLGLEQHGTHYVGTLRVPLASSEKTPSALPSNVGNQNATLVVFSQEMDKVMAALIIALGARAMGGKASLFFTFWGLNALRKDQVSQPVNKTFMDKMFGWMLPRGVDKLPLSNMDFAGLGRKMMKDRMASKNLPNAAGLLEEARKQGVRMIACGMSMEAMGLKAEELIDGVEFGGVAEFLAASNQSDTNLFI